MEERVLIVDDDQSMCELLQAGLKRRGFDAVFTMVADEALALLSSQDFSVVITDLQMEGMDGIELCRRIVSSRSDVSVVVITAFGSMEAAIAAIRAGAYDFIAKPFEMDHVAITVERAVKHRALQREVKRLKQAVAEARRFGEMVGKSAPMKDVFDMVSRVAETEATVLVTGESGTGKELIARALHDRSRRREGPFVGINCAALPEHLLESELFGHVRGAFTDAKTARTGLFVTATNGTLFLDEIGEMPTGMQVKLLRALQERTVRPIGSSVEVPFDTRIVTATSRDLETEVGERRFREDLFYRINVVRIHVPPLRERGRDLLLLAQYFVEKFAVQNNKHVVGLSSPAAERLLAYNWPGNVRELQNCVERAVALTQFDQLTVDDLPEKVRNYGVSRVIVDSEDPADMLPMDEVERRYILRVLQAVGGNKTQAAEVLGFDRKTLYRKLERWGTVASARQASALAEPSGAVEDGPLEVTGPSITAAAPAWCGVSG